MQIISIDPGTVGAYAVMGGASIHIHIADLPTHLAQHGRNGKTRTELDLHQLRDVIAGHDIRHCFIERATARPGQGVTSMFRFGEAAGALYGLLIGLMVPISFVRPLAWQRHHGIGASPDAARQRASQLFPDLAPRLVRKRDCHRADALLIGSYGLHQLHHERN